jgi:hypothetical protein
MVAPPVKPGDSGRFGIPVNSSDAAICYNHQIIGLLRVARIDISMFSHSLLPRHDGGDAQSEVYLINQ